MSKRFDSDESEEPYDYGKLLKRPEWLQKSAEIKTKLLRCEKCGRTGGRLAVHHRSYEYGRMPWDYPDEVYVVVCSGRCHGEADGDREEEQETATTNQRYGWQGELGRKLLRPSENELRKLEKYQEEFKAWLIRKGILREPWDWSVWPMSSLWNQLSDEFLAERQDDERKGRLVLF